MESESVSFSLMSDYDDQTAQTYESMELSPTNSWVPPSVASDVEPISLKWELHLKKFKPKNQDSLYYKIFANRNHMQPTILHTLEFIQAHKGVDVMQFFLDLAGYFKVDLKQQDESPTDVIKKLENSKLGLETPADDFIFVKPSNIALFYEESLEVFCQQYLNYFSLYPSLRRLSYQIVGFVDAMCHSQVRSVRATGVIIGNKFLTALVNKYQENLLVEETSSNLAQLKQEREEMEKLIDFFFQIFHKNCLLQDDNVYYMRGLCAKETYNLIKADSDTFLDTDQLTSRLTRLITDEHKFVRMSALKALEQIVQIPNLDNLPGSAKIQVCMGVAAKRFNDLNEDVAAKSVDIFRALLENGLEKWIKNPIKKEITAQLFQKRSLKLAKAAGRFFTTLLRVYDKKGLSLLNHMISMALTEALTDTKNIDHTMMCLVEVFFESCEEFSDPNLMVEFLTSSRLSSNTKKLLLILARESLRFWLTGKLLKRRSNEENKREFNLDSHSAVAVAFITNMKEIIKAIDQNQNIIRIFLEIMSFIKFDFCMQNLPKEDMDVFFKFLNEVFLKCKHDEKIHNVVLDVVALISKGDPMYEEAFKKRVVQKVTDGINEDLNKSDVPVQVNLNSLKLASLYTIFDLGFDFEYLKKAWQRNFYTFRYFYVCMKMNVVWKLRDSNTDYNEFMFASKEFFKYSVAAIEWLGKKKKHQEIALFVFSHFCDFYHKVLAVVEDFHGDPNLRYFVDGKQDDEQIIMDFFENNVLLDLSSFLTLKERQDYLCKFFCVLRTGIFNLEAFSKITLYFYDKYDEFGEIIKKNLILLANQQKDTLILPLIIHHTLYLKYEYYAEHQLSKINFDKIMHLSSCFANLDCIEAVELKKLFIFGTTYALKIERNYFYLNLLIPFTKKMNKATREAICEEFQTASERISKNRFIINFYKVLQK